MGRRNFVVFLLLAFVQQFDCTYEKTFMSYTINHVAGSDSRDEGLQNQRDGEVPRANQLWIACMRGCKHMVSQ